MKRVPWLLALVSAVLLSDVSAPAADDFYVIGAGRPSVGTKITSVPYTISAPGYYYLTSNLSYTLGYGAGITVDADNVTIDLMGFRLAGPGSSYGIVWGQKKNIEVRNGTVSGFYMGVWGNDTIDGGGHHRIINLRANGNTYGVWMNGDDILIKGCTAIQGSFGSGAGLTIYNGSGIISGCTVMDFGGEGITLGGGGKICGNVVSNCSGSYSGIYANSAATISYNYVSSSGPGIFAPAGGSIIGNVVYAYPGQTGIIHSTDASTPNMLDQNTVWGEGLHYGNGSSATVWGLNAGR